jgi:hypothetical protein
LVAHHLAKVRVAGSSPVVRSKGPRDLSVEWPRGEARDCKSLYTGSNPVSTSQQHQHGHHRHGRLAQGLARFLDTEEVTGSNPVSPTMATIRRLLGVYDADGGLRGEIAYIAGKFRGRHCSLCDITHSPVRRRRDWDAYVGTLPVPFDVVHRNERSPALTRATEGREACVVAECNDGSIAFLLGNDELTRAGDVQGLAQALGEAVDAAGLQWPDATFRP